MIMEAVQERHLKLKGFYAHRVETNHQFQGFELCDAATFGGGHRPVSKPPHFVTVQDGQTHWQPQIFATYGVSLLSDIHPGDTVLLDEIGGIELTVSSFYQRLIALFQQDIRIIGVFKGTHNYQHQKQNPVDPLNVDSQREHVLALINQQPGQLVTVTDNQPSIRRRLVDFLA